MRWKCDVIIVIVFLNISFVISSSFDALLIVMYVLILSISLSVIFLVTRSCVYSYESMSMRSIVEKNEKKNFKKISTFFVESNFTCNIERCSYNVNIYVFWDVFLHVHLHLLHICQEAKANWFKVLILAKTRKTLIVQYKSRRRKEKNYKRMRIIK